MHYFGLLHCMVQVPPLSFSMRHLQGLHAKAHGHGPRLTSGTTATGMGREIDPVAALFGVSAHLHVFWSSSQPAEQLRPGHSVSLSLEAL